MKNAFKKYLFLLNIILLTGFANLYANSDIQNTAILKASNTSAQATNSSTTHSFNQLQFNTSSSNNERKTYSEYVDEENFEEDDEEKLNVDFKPFNFSCPIASIFYAQLLDGLTCEIKENTQRYIYNYSKSSIPLHVKFQVFII